MSDGNINGRRVRELRDARDLSQRALASLAGCSQPRIRQIEAGGGASLGLARRLAEVFGVRLDYLVTQDLQPATPPASADPRPAARASPG